MSNTTTLNPSFSKTPAGQCILSQVILAWPDLYTAVPFKNDPKNTPRYGVTVLIPKESEAGTQLQAEINAMAKDKLKIAKLSEQDSCLQDGDNKSNEALHGYWVLSLYAYPSDKKARGGAPRVVNRNKQDIKPTDSDAPYSGSYGTVIFDLYTPTNWKKVSGGLHVVQVTGGGPAIGFSTDLSVLPDLPDDGSDGLDPDDV